MFSSAPPSYYYPSDYYDPYGYSRGPSLAQQRALAAARQQALEQQRAQRLRRQQYLPHESDDDIDDGSYGYYTPYNQLYLDGLRRKEALERAEEDYNQRRLEVERQEQLLREKEQQRREQLKNAHRQQQVHRIPVRSSHSPTSRPTSSQSTQKPTHRPSTPPARPDPPVRSPSPQTLQRRHEAATLIQNSFRVHHALLKLKDLDEQFEKLKASYTLPSTIDFQGPEGIISIHPSAPQPSSSDTLSSDVSETNTPKLAFNSTNYPLHSYTESLNRLLLKLDSIESWGDANVRKTRRRLASRVEGEASRVEVFWKQAWVSYIQGGGNESKNEGTMAIDEEEHASEAEMGGHQPAEVFETVDSGKDVDMIDKAEDVQNSVQGGGEAMEEDQWQNSVDVDERKADDGKDAQSASCASISDEDELGTQVGDEERKDNRTSQAALSIDNTPEIVTHRETQDPVVEDGDFVLVPS